MARRRPTVVIVSPALADANNGNWRTAHRWARFLAPLYSVCIEREWAGDDTGDLMLALHARRSAASIAAWRARAGPRGLAVVLTGTDLYRDLPGDASAMESLRLADRLVVLQGRGIDALPAAYRGKARVIVQSATAHAPHDKTTRHLQAVMVGHLRAEKAPETLFAAARLLAGRKDIRMRHIGAALDPALAVAARETTQAAPGYRWLGALAHAATRQHIDRAHVLLQPSRMEGGAHTVIEAICGGTPVLASRIDGNVGLLGDDYAGYFAPGDATALAGLLQTCRATQHQADGLLARLAAQCRRRLPLFAPAREAAAVRELAAELLALR